MLPVTHPPTLRSGFLQGCCLAFAGLMLAVGPSLADDSRSTVASPSKTPPPPITTKHTMKLNGETLHFTAIAGTLPIQSKSSGILADVSFTAYLKTQPTSPKNHPITFVFNGGPGAASAWLHLGAMGPWRIDFAPGSQNNQQRETKRALRINQDTWLPFTDLVFIDPVETGFSRIRKTKNKKRTAKIFRSIASVAGDMRSISKFIRDWLYRYNRTGAPIALAGESYGGYRAPKIAYRLQDEYGIGTAALILISPVLDFEGRRGEFVPKHFAGLLPSLVAVAREDIGLRVTRAGLTSVERYARSDFLVDLHRGVNDIAAIRRMATHIARFTGLPGPAIEKRRGRLNASDFLNILRKGRKLKASLYDGSVTEPTSVTKARRRRYRDPFTGTVSPKLIEAMNDLHSHHLKWHPGTKYVLQNRRVNYRWRWPNTPNATESVEELVDVLKDQDKLRVLITHGFTDLVTPYFATQMVLNQVPILSNKNRVTHRVLPGGHMFYSRAKSRAGFTAAARRIIERKPAAEPAKPAYQPTP